MRQPQSNEEIRPFIDDLQRIDPLLDIYWEPRACIVVPGSYSALGERIDPTYDGRWRVIRYDSAEHGHAGFHPERGYTVICDVTTYGEQDGILYMVVDGAYEPIDRRLVTLMRSADGWNTEQHRQIQKKLWAQHDANDDAQHALDESMALEGLDRVHFKANFAGGVGNWQGKGADFPAMERAATQRAVSRILSTSK